MFVNVSGFFVYKIHKKPFFKILTRFTSFVYNKNIIKLILLSIKKTI